MWGYVHAIIRMYFVLLPKGWRKQSVANRDKLNGTMQQHQGNNQEQELQEQEHNGQSAAYRQRYSQVRYVRRKSRLTPTGLMGSTRLPDQNMSPQKLTLLAVAVGKYKTINTIGVAAVSLGATIEVASRAGIARLITG